MPAVLKHLSVAVDNPKRAADVLAEMTLGKVSVFHPVEGAFVCLWPDWNGQFIEFYPKGAQVIPTNDGADFEITKNESQFTSMHINVHTDLTGDDVKSIAARHGYKHHFRPSHGGPLHEVWIENTFLVELVTVDLR